ncbi:Protein naked cuticle [Lucilia cuprina]|nr:Protein naked cuticle [Lucilia cuprina]
MIQECTTDSEELMYHQVRASSSCSAPPDLLLVSDRENNIPLRSPVVNIIAATTAATAPATTTTSPSSGINACHLTSVSNNNQRHHQQKLQQQHQLQQQQHHHHVTTQQLSLAYNGTKDMVVGNNSSSNGKHQKQTNKHGQQQQQLSQTDCQQPQQQTLQHEIEGQQLESQTNNHSSTRHAHHTQQQQSHHQQSSQQQRSDDHIRLEEFTCDVSVEGGKSSQPLQFSFTFYDLDGHHGKITKDDIVGIVYTIYESIGKSVVVPHSGSKTINVRLTVSPEGKSKASKNKKTSSSAAVVLDSNQKSASQAARRLHRYRPRKLIKSDEEDDDSNSEKERDTTAINSSNLSHVLSAKTSSKAHKLHKPKANEHHCCATPNNPDLTTSPLETIYDNLKATTAVTTPEACRECLAAVDESRSAAISPIAQYHPAHAKINSSATNEAYMKHVASTRIKMLRKSRKQKHQDCMETRQRSLSVGNETCWKNRHLQKPPANSTQQQLLWHAEQQLNNSAGGVVAGATDMVDGVQLRNPLKSTASGGGKVSSSSAQKRNSAECWKTALNRNDLISIIRESMEKNRLCFQLNGKPQANVSPIRHSQPTQQTTQTQQQHHQQHLHHNQHNSSNNNKHSQATTPTNSQRQRSNTVSKIPTLIANHNSAHTTHSPQHNHYPSNSSNNGQQRSSSCVNTISNNNQLHDTSLPTETLNISSSNSSYQHQHLQPHIPIYHQQMAINPAVIAAHNALLGGNGGSGSAAGHHGKMNLCGYDSFLHATICGGGLSHSPPAHTSLAAQITSPLASALSSGQQIATVQPIMSTNSPNASKHLSLAVTANQIKTSKILRSGSYAQNQHHHHQQQHLLQTHSQTTQNSPQYHGYQRLPSSSKHNLSALHLVSPTMEKPALEQLDKWRRDQVKNYDQLLYAKLSEKLQQTNLVSTNGINSRESNPRRKHRVLRQRRPNQLIAEANNVSLSSKLKANKLCLREENDYTTILPLEEVDAVECENLLGHSSEEDTHSHNESPVHNGEKLLEDNNLKRHVAEGTLVDLDDVDDDDDEEEVQQVLTQSSSLGNHAINADTLLRVENDEVHHLHLEDNLEIEEDLEEDLDDDLEEDVDEVAVNGAVNESGRNSAASNDSNPTGATLANTNGAANTSTTSSSLIHRYVHEHIHHHYHHFEEKEE